jgi:hypothetical protein
MMWERRQLQNGADAAALALATQCAKDQMACTSTNGVIRTYNNANAKDGSSSTDAVCARFSGTNYSSLDGSWDDCASATDSATDEARKQADVGACVPLPAWLKGPGGSTTPYVEVRTGTSAAGSAPGPLPAIFSKAVTGNDNPHEAACARAAWGPPGSFQGSLPLAISICEFQRYTGSTVVDGIPGDFTEPPSGPGTGYGGVGQPAYPLPYAGWPNQKKYEQYVMTHSDKTADCSVNGKDTAGGFGWLTAASGCITNVQTSNNTDYWAKIETGNAVPSDCTSVIDSYYGKTLLLPVFDCLVKSTTGLPSGGISTQTCDGVGGTTYYHLAGFASFYLSGNKLSNKVGKTSVVNGKLPCSGESPVSATTPNPWTGESGRCISGWFVSGTLQAPTISSGGAGGGNFGSTTIAPAG